MKKEIKILVCIFLLIIFIVLILYVITSFYGNPIRKRIARKEINKYLGNKYDYKMLISDINYNMKYDEYVAIAHPEKNNEVFFRVYPKNGTYQDEYFKRSWEVYIDNFIKKYLNNNFKFYFLIHTEIGRNPLNNEYNKNNISNIPDYKNIKHLIKDYTQISIWLEKKFENDKNANYKVMYNLIDYLKGKVNYDRLLIDFELDSKSFEIEDNGFNINNRNDIANYEIN